MDRTYKDESQNQRNDKDAIDALIRSHIGKVVGIRSPKGLLIYKAPLLHCDGKRVAVNAYDGIHICDLSTYCLELLKT